MNKLLFKQKIFFIFFDRLDAYGYVFENATLNIKRCSYVIIFYGHPNIYKSLQGANVFIDGPIPIGILIYISALIFLFK